MATKVMALDVSETTRGGVARTLSVSESGLDFPRCEKGIGSVINAPDSDRLIEGVRVKPLSLWADDRGHFLEVQRAGLGLTSEYPLETTQISATLTYAGVVKAFHYHLKQFDCWTVVNGMMQVALVDFRKGSKTYGQRNTLYVGDRRPWQILIPPGVGHGYKVIGKDPAVLVYATSRVYDPADELRVPYDDNRLNYDWETQFK